MLNEEEFVSFYYQLMSRPDIDTIFRQYSDTSAGHPEGRMTAEKLAQFFTQEQVRIPISKKDLSILVCISVVFRIWLNYSIINNCKLSFAYVQCCRFEIIYFENVFERRHILIAQIQILPEINENVHTILLKSNN